MSSLTSSDGLSLHLLPGPPPAGPVQGSVLILHGLGEHAGRCAHVMAHLAAQGWASLACDQRGHGRSGGPRGGLPADDRLLLYAGADRCVAPRGSDEFAAAAPPAVLSARRYDGLSHEIFNEPDRARVLADLSAWLASHPAR